MFDSKDSFIGSKYTACILLLILLYVPGLRAHLSKRVDTQHCCCNCPDITYNVAFVHVINNCQTTTSTVHVARQIIDYLHWNELGVPGSCKYAPGHVAGAQAACKTALEQAKAAALLGKKSSNSFWKWGSESKYHVVPFGNFGTIKPYYYGQQRKHWPMVVPIK